MHIPDHFDSRPSLNDRLAQVAARGMRIAKYLALSFALAVVGGIGIGVAVADNAFVQIFVMFLAAIALWLPILLAALWVDSRLDHFRRRKPAVAEAVIEATAMDASWTRLMRAAPAERDRIVAIQRSLSTSHLALRDAPLDPDAHDLCVLIDRRLPELIDRALDSLPPDDRGRKEKVASLVDLVEQFADHCGRADNSTYEAEVLRRRFEERLTPPELGAQ